MIRSYLKSKAKQKLGKYRDKLHSGLLDACEELKSHRKTNPADKHLPHIRSELNELGIEIKPGKYGAYYQVYPKGIKNLDLRENLTVQKSDIHDAWEAGKELVAELAKLHVKSLDKAYAARQRSKRIHRN